MVGKFFSKPEPLETRLDISYKPVVDQVEQVVLVHVKSLRSVQIGVYNASDSNGSLVINCPSGKLKIEYATFSIQEILDGVRKPVRFPLRHSGPHCSYSTHAVNTTYQYSFDGFAPCASGKYIPSSFACLVNNRV